MTPIRIGHDLTKWAIYRNEYGNWFVCPPSKSGRLLSDCPPPFIFTRGLDALAAFNAGASQ